MPKYADSRRRLASLACLLLAAGGAGAAPEFYVPAGRADQVLAIDAATGAVAGRIEDVENPHGAALVPGARRLLAASLSPAPAQAAAAPTPAGVSAPDHAAHHGDGTGSDGGVLYLIDTAERLVLRRFHVPGPVHHVLVTPDGRYAVSTHPGGDGVSVLDLETGRLAAQPATGAEPNYAVASPDGGRIYVSNAGSGTVTELAADGWATLRTLEVGGRPEHLAIAPAGNRLYINDTATGQVLAVDLTGGEVVGRYPVGQGLHGIGLSPDGSILYASAAADDRLVAVALASGRRRAVHLAPAPYHLAAAPESTALYVSSRAEPLLWRLDPHSLEVLGTTRLPGTGHQFAVGALRR